MYESSTARVLAILARGRLLAVAVIFALLAVSVWQAVRPVWLPDLKKTASLNFIEYQLPAGRSPANIVQGPDSRYHFTITGNGGPALGAINPDGSGQVFYPTPTNCSPNDLVVGADGNLWFTEPNCNRIGRMGTDGSSPTEYQVPSGLFVPWDIVLGPDLNLWFTLKNGLTGTGGGDTSISAVGRLNPADGSFTIYRLTAFGQPTGITVGPDNNIWVAEPGNQMVARIGTNTGLISEFSVGTNATELTKGSDANIWFAGDNHNQIGRLTPTGASGATVTLYGLPASATTYTIMDVVLAPDGNVWYTANRTDNSGTTTAVLGNFDINGAVQDFPLPSATDPCCQRSPGGIYSDNIGQIWYTDANQHLVGHTGSVQSNGASEFFGGRNPSEPLSTCVVCAKPINPAFGDMWHSFTDLAVPGRGAVLVLARTYDSLLAGQSGPLGFGWTHSYLMSLRLDGAGNAVIVQENASQVRFTVGAGGTFNAPPRVLATLTRNSDGSLTLKRKDLSTFTFNVAGQLVAEGDRNGYATALGYTSGQLSSVTDPAGRSLAFTYNPDGHLASVVDPAGRTVAYQYSSAGDLIAATDVGGATSKFAYDANHHMTVMTDANGGATSTAYDGFGRAVGQTDPLGRTWGFQYGAGQTTVTKPNGRTDVLTFTSGLLVSATYASGTGIAETIKYEYDPATGGVTKLTDPAGHVMTASYDASGNLLRAADSLGRTISFAYSALGDVLSATDELGITTSLSRDGAGNLLAISRPEGGSGSPVETVSYAYGDAVHPGDVTAVVDQIGKRWRMSYDAAGDLLSESDPLGNVVAMTYDSVGRVRSAVSAGGHVYARTFNAYGDTLSLTDPLGSVTTSQYDAVGNLVASNDASGGITSYTYNADNELVKLVRADGSVQGNVLDAEGNTIAQSDAMGNVTRFSYDLLNHPVSSTDAVGRTMTRAFDVANNMTSITDAAGRTTSFTYDSANMLLGIAYSDGLTHAVSYSYDARGRRVSMTDRTGTSTYAYDSFGRLAATSDGSGQQTTYRYDLRGQLVSLTYPSGAVVTRSYDDAGRLTNVTDWAGHTSRFSYDADGNIVSEVLGNGIRGALSYDAAKNLTGIRYDPPSGQSGGPLLGWTYQHDAQGRLTAAIPASASSGPVQRYSYDSVSRLTAETNFINLTYKYDPSYNLVQVTGAGEDPLGTATYTYDAAHQLVQTVIQHDQQTVASFNYTYDANGNRTQVKIGGSSVFASYAYDQANRLVGFTAGNATTTYGYNGDSLRVSKTVAGTTQKFAWDIAQGMPLVLADGKAQYVYGPGGQPLEQVGSDGRPHYFLPDHQGSTRALAGQDGRLESTFQYNAYGQLIAFQGRQSSSLLYTGQYLDKESNLYSLGARMYDPLTAQFITRDPMEAATRSAYGYAGDNPANAADPSGLMTVGTCGDLQGMLFVLNLGGHACLSTVVGKPSEIGVTGTPFWGVGVGAGFSPGVSVQVSNADTLSDLTSWFLYASVSAVVGVGVSLTVFYGWNAAGKFIYGGDFGPAAVVDVGFVPLGESYTWLHTLGGWQADMARSVLHGIASDAAGKLDLVRRLLGDHGITGTPGQKPC